MVLEKVFRVSNRQPRISMAARATRLRSRPRSTTLSSSLRHLDTSMHLLLDATILYFIRNGKQENCEMPALRASWRQNPIRRNPRGNPGGPNFERPYLGQIAVTRAEN